MTAELVQFEFESIQVRTVVGDDGEPLFVGKDVADALGYQRSRDAIAQHCKGAVKRRLPTSNGDQDMTVIPERDVYRLIMRSKLPAAERFEEWVVGEVLPAIRKTGSYSVKSPVELYQEALALMESDKERASLSGKNLNEWKKQRRDHAENVKKLYAYVQMLLGFEF
jgi:prophage antirepressor-like protein